MSGIRQNLTGIVACFKIVECTKIQSDRYAIHLLGFQWYFFIISVYYAN